MSIQKLRGKAEQLLRGGIDGHFWLLITAYMQEVTACQTVIHGLCFADTRSYPEAVKVTHECCFNVHHILSPACKSVCVGQETVD